MPLSLNGRLVLPKASCSACQEKTQKIEEVCTAEKWGMFYPLRAKHKMRTRRRGGWKNRDKVTAEVIRNGVVTKQTFDAASMPVVVSGLELSPAGILLGLEPTNRIECTIVMRMQDPTGSFKPEGDSGLVKFGSIRPTALLQLVAKIGYSFAAAETGCDGLLPSLADIILHRSDKAPYLVGGGIPTLQGLQVRSDESDYLYKLQMHEFVVRGDAFTVASVHLFGQLGMPYYHVVVRHRSKNE